MTTNAEPEACSIRARVPDELVAMITGCASGIGRGTALAFAALNYKLVLVDKQAGRLAETGLLCAQKSPRGFKVRDFECLPFFPTGSII